MKKIIKAFIIVALALFSLVTVAYAYTGARGQVIDSKEKDGWTYGGEVWIYVAQGTNAGDICATTTLDSNGNFLATLDGATDDLSQGPLSDCTGPTYANDTFTILIDFTCGINSANCTGTPLGYPATLSHEFTQNVIPVTYNAGYLESGTGPNAVVLTNMSVQSTSQTWLTATIAVATLAIISGAVLIRKRKVSS